jgi:hypothetical protein
MEEGRKNVGDETFDSAVEREGFCVQEFDEVSSEKQVSETRKRPENFFGKFADLIVGQAQESQISQANERVWVKLRDGSSV